VTARYDEGPVLASLEVPVLPGDTADTLAARILKAEHALLPRVVQDLVTSGWTGSTAGGKFEASTTARASKPSRIS
jgi:folate-dependent phosphoribosylglycinamide formyltransferase PurN